MRWNGREPYRDREEAGEVLLAAIIREGGSWLRMGVPGDEGIPADEVGTGGEGDNGVDGKAEAELGVQRHHGARAIGVVVLGAPRGGVAVAVPVARGLGAPLDVVLARKLPAPGNPELGFGAVGEGGVRVVDAELVVALGLTEAEISEIAAEVEDQIRERAARYRNAHPAVPLEGKTALIIDDGVATGGTMEAAVASARARGATRVVAAAPVSSDSGRDRLVAVADQFICPWVDPDFLGVGAFYRDFPQLSDQDVVRLLGG